MNLFHVQFLFTGLSDDIAYNSLSDLVKLCFGKPLNKTEQFSNWEKIPLRYNQIKYAGMYTVLLNRQYILCIFNISNQYSEFLIFLRLSVRNFWIHRNKMRKLSYLWN